MKRKVTILDVLAIWLALSFVTGALLNQVKWGEPDGFHGTGWPIPSVIWDKHPDTGELVDFVSHPFVMALNPMLVFAAGALLVSLFRFGRRMFCKLKGRASSGTLHP